MNVQLPLIKFLFFNYTPTLIELNRKI